MTRPRLLMLRPLGLGDLLTAVPAMRAAARAFPEHEHLLAGPAVLAPLALMSGAIDHVIDVRPLEPLPGACHNAAVAIDLHGRGPASQRILLAAHPSRLIAFANSDVPQTAGFPRWREGEHEVARWCRLLSENGIPTASGDLDLPVPMIDPPAIASGAAIVHPGAAYPARRWPAERWAEVAAALAPNVVITGGASEAALAMRVASRAGIPAERVLAGKTDLAQLAAVVASARVVISGDTGIAHLATAMRTPSVVLFGPTSPARWGPPPDRPWHRVIWKGREGNPNAMQPDAGLLAITVEEVLDAVAPYREAGHAVRA